MTAARHAWRHSTPHPFSQVTAGNNSCSVGQLTPPRAETSCGRAPLPLNDPSAATSRVWALRCHPGLSVAEPWATGTTEPGAALPSITYLTGGETESQVTHGTTRHRVQKNPSSQSVPPSRVPVTSRDTWLGCSGPHSWGCHLHFNNQYQSQRGKVACPEPHSLPVTLALLGGSRVCSSIEPGMAKLGVHGCPPQGRLLGSLQEVDRPWASGWPLGVRHPHSLICLLRAGSLV